MHQHPISYLMFSTIFNHFLFFLFLVLALAVDEDGGNPRCKPFGCGTLGIVSFPFFNGTNSDCGLWKMDKCDEDVPRIQLDKDWPPFYVTAISQTNTITLQESNTFATNPLKYCAYRNLSLPRSPIISVEPYNQTFFRCPRNRTYANFNAACEESKHFNIGYQNSSSDDEFRRKNTDCSMIQLQVNKTQKGVDFFNLYTGWFRLQLNVTRECSNCFLRGGLCIDNQGHFQCSEELNSRTDGKSFLKLGLGIGMPAAIGIGIFIILAFCFMKRSSDNYMIFWKKKANNYHNIEALLRNHGSLATKRYNYSEIKKMTNSFIEKLGEGGYGGVYRGKLLDGRNVAVKVLKEAKGNGEELISEVSSISRTSHVNIVALLGFSFEGHKRALVYEFMPNGSLEKFIYGKSMETNQKLKWETLYQIVVGIARGLEYLHHGCSTRILHFDIKPHNILLDEEFCPKISDFGLAKICLKKESIVSLTGARGTIGYIAPKVVSRNFGEVSHKSDVYIYGMMVFEMVGGRKIIDVGVGHTSEIYFPHWIYNRLEVDEELGLKGIESEEDQECAKKMIIVSLWCIQINPLDRPTISRVVDMLEGSISSLQIPPKPFLSSPRSAPRDSSATLLS